MNKVVLLFATALVTLICECSTPVAGGSSQQGNGYVVGRVVTADGQPLEGALVRIRPQDYLVQPATAAETSGENDAETDVKGRFSVAGVEPGEYSVEVNDRESSAVLLYLTVRKQDDTTNAGEFGLAPYTGIEGVVTGSRTSSPRFIQIRGIERLLPIDTNGAFSVNDLPAGNFDLRLVSADSTVEPIEIFNIDATAEAAATMVIAPKWRYARRFRLNTTPKGADVAADVTDFPVLVRLTAAMFDFGQANRDGSDIRFIGSGTAFLPYAIEQWDPDNLQAAVWVKVDTVFGGNSMQGVTMYWGNADAPAASDNAAVFDTADGYAGVWHLSNNDDRILDATAAARNGENSGSALAPGIIGNAREFTDGDYIRIGGLFDTPQNVTLSAWVSYDTATEGQDIISIGDAVLIRVDDSVYNIGTAGSYHNDSILSDTNFAYASSREFLAKTGWHHLAYTINAEAHVQTLYIDGVQHAVSYDVNPIHYGGLGTDTYLGRHGNGKTDFNYIGILDEVRICTIARSADWAKLSYMNQMAGDYLVVW
jgi:hypothetical protein